MLCSLACGGDQLTVAVPVGQLLHHLSSVHDAMKHYIIQTLQREFTILGNALFPKASVDLLGLYGGRLAETLGSAIKCHYHGNYLLCAHVPHVTYSA